ncbi:hypothetical protein TorRG33x02_035990 [Trema orientale]|uniref:Uncharacterized protein n=1 Tax=Trema orientale TaxID=63057 RepID=A0A2P5FRT4_TREOI|nr:hypothetical protein TorRG33x02_035990 [Trema orientale]
MSLCTNDDQVIPGRYRDNPNIIKDPVTVKTKGSGYIGSSTDGILRPGSSGTVKKSRLCRIYYGVNHDARNCQSRSMRKSNGGASTSYNASDVATANSHDYMINDSTQDSIHSTDFI